MTPEQVRALEDAANAVGDQTVRLATDSLAWMLDSYQRHGSGITMQLLTRNWSHVTEGKPMRVTVEVRAWLDPLQRDGHMPGCADLDECAAPCPFAEVPRR